MPKLIDRREFLWLGIISFFAAIFAYLAAAARSLFPNVLYEPPPIFKIGTPEKFPQDTTTYLEEKKLFVFHDAKGLFCISAICTHLGCNVRLAKEGFECPCHGSVFDKIGKVLKGPAPRALEWYELSFSRTGELIVNTQEIVEADFRLKV